MSLYLTVHTVEAIRQLQARAGYTTGPLFRRMLKGDHMSNDRLTVDGARLAIKASAKQIGIEGVSGHSLRIGTAQELVQRGASLVELQKPVAGPIARCLPTTPASRPLAKELWPACWEMTKGF